jgi:hypothetical protein
MSKEKPLTKNYNTTIFHPFLLNFNDITKKNTHAIIPELISSKNNLNTLDDFKIISDNKIKEKDKEKDKENYIKNFKKSKEQNKYFLMYNFNIKNIDDIFELLNNLIDGNNNINTIDFLLNLIISVFKDEIDDIYIDKFINFYKIYFEKYFETTIEYKNMFKIIKNNLEKEYDIINTSEYYQIHTNIIKSIQI